MTTNGLSSYNPCKFCKLGLHAMNNSYLSDTVCEHHVSSQSVICSDQLRVARHRQVFLG